MPLETALLNILACPEDKGPLYYLMDEEALYNPRLRRRYRIDGDIPVMLSEEATTADVNEHQRIMDKVHSQSLALTFDPSSSSSQDSAGEQE